MILGAGALRKSLSILFLFPLLLSPDRWEKKVQCSIF